MSKGSEPHVNIFLSGFTKYSLIDARNKTKESRQVREMILGKLPKYMKLNKNFD